MWEIVLKASYYGYSPYSINYKKVTIQQSWFMSHYKHQDLFRL